MVSHKSSDHTGEWDQYILWPSNPHPTLYVTASRSARKVIRISPSLPGISSQYEGPIAKPNKRMLVQALVVAATHPILTGIMIFNQLLISSDNLIWWNQPVFKDSRSTWGCGQDLVSGFKVIIHTQYSTFDMSQNTKHEVIASNTTYLDTH